jgi:hypothetical protein
VISYFYFLKFLFYVFILGFCGLFCSFLFCFVFVCVCICFVGVKLWKKRTRAIRKGGEIQRGKAT